MEHRCSSRVATPDIPVLISQFNKPIAKGRIKDATAFGFYIESDWTTHQLQQLCLEVVLDKKKFKLEAIVTHVEKDGFGVELEQLENDDIHFVHKLVITKKAVQQFDEQIALVVNG